MPFSSMNFLELVISCLSFLGVAFTPCAVTEKKITVNQ